MSALQSYEAALAALAWQVELGADEAIAETSFNRFEEEQQKPKLKLGAASNIQLPTKEIPTFVQEAASDVAQKLAASSSDLDQLRNAIATFEHCALKKGARNLVFADGNPNGPIMIVGEAPGRDEDIQGLPFVGAAGQLLDKMFAAIDMSRSVEDDNKGVYITNVMPWRPPQNRDPSEEEITMMLPFLRRHVELANPKLIVLMGNTACKAVLDKTGITRMRGNWHTAFDRPAMPMFHPAALLRDPSKKRHAWSDLLAIQKRLADGD